MTLNQISTEFVDLIKQTSREFGEELKVDAEYLKVYFEGRMIHLQTLVGQKGFTQALIAERDNVALTAAGRAIDRADAFDNRILGIVQGALSIGIKALVLV